MDVSVGVCATLGRWDVPATGVLRRDGGPAGQ
ncbi:hypothetical protein ABID74_003960 [Gordonia terrae]